MSPDQAAKLKGKLMFADPQFWGKPGRAFMRALGERQYSPGRTTTIDLPLWLALHQWLHILDKAKPRGCAPVADQKVQAVIFTDGYYPDNKGPKEPGIGGVVFVEGKWPAFFSEVVQSGEMASWQTRKTQIVPIEMLAAVRALQVFDDYIKGTRVIFFIDSEAVEGALVKGYSRREDLCELVGVFWALVRALDCDVYIERIPTDANLADTPSRGALGVAKECLWKRRRAAELVLKRMGLGCTRADLWTGGSVTMGLRPSDQGTPGAQGAEMGGQS
jgi:hypothetical protein